MVAICESVNVSKRAGANMGKKSRETKRAIRGLTPEQIAAGRASGHLITLTRKEILVRLLDTAIWLWFLKRDPVAIHTLACAALDNLGSLGKDTGKEPTLKRIYSDAELMQAYNVFKHASGDPNEITDFPPGVNTILILDTSNSFFKIFGSRTPYMATFAAYFVVVLAPKFPSGSFDPEALIFLPENVEVDDVRKLNRVEFLNKLLPLFERSPLL